MRPTFPVYLIELRDGGRPIGLYLHVCDDVAAGETSIVWSRDTSGLEAGKTVGTELQQLLAAIAGMVVTPSINSGAIDAAAAKVRQLAADLAALNKGGGAGGGTSGPVGTSYPQTAPTGRQMGPR